MKLGTLIPIIVGVAVSLFVLNYFRARPAPAPKYWAVRDDPGSKDIEAYQPIILAMIMEKDWDKRDTPMPKEYITDASRLLPLNAGDPPRFTKVAIARGQPIRETDLFEVGTRSLMAGILEANPEMRGKTIAVDPVRGGGGHVRPGNLVDVMATIPDPVKGEASPSARMVQEGVLVLAINDSDVPVTGADAAGAGRTGEANLPRYVTLGMTPAQAERLEVIEAIPGAKIKLVIRGKNALAANSRGTSLRDALGLPPEEPAKAPAPPPAPIIVQAPPPPPKPAEPPRSVVRVYKGGARTDFVFQKGQPIQPGEDRDDAETDSETSDVPSGAHSPE